MPDEDIRERTVEPGDELRLVDLYVREVGLGEYAVLDLGIGSERDRTVNVVDVRDRTCTCGQEDEPADLACDHLAAAVYAGRPRLPDEVLWDMVSGPAVPPLSSQNGAHPESGDSGPSDAALRAAVERWLADEGAPAGKLSVGIDGNGDVSIAKDGFIEDDDFNRFMDATQGEEYVRFDKDNQRHYIPRDRVGEVVG